MKFTKKEKIAYGILGILLFMSGIYGLITGVAGGVPGTSSEYDTGFFGHIWGLVLTIIGGYILYKIYI